MKVRFAAATVLLLLTATVGHAGPGKLAGTDGASCRPGESGPALLAAIGGFKDRTGNVRIELYPPAVDADFLTSSKVLIAAGKTFRRVEIPVPASGDVTLCIRAPHAGDFAVSVLHDRKGDGKFAATSDGAGFGNNPKLGLSKPKAAAATLAVGPGVTETRIVLNYYKGLLSFGPVRDPS